MKNAKHKWECQRQEPEVSGAAFVRMVACAADFVFQFLALLCYRKLACSTFYLQSACVLECIADGAKRKLQMPCCVLCCRIPKLLIELLLMHLLVFVQH